MERVFITGAAGYVGSVLAPFLLREGYAVRALDRFRHRHPGLLRLAGDPNFEPVRGDCRDAALLRECLRDVDWVIPLAAIVGAPACDANKHDVVSTNLGSIAALLGEMGKDQKLLYPNTNSGYGTTAPGTVCTEETPLKPISLYGRTKKEAEDLVMGKHRNSMAFRFATAFGVSPRMRLDLLVNDFVHRAVTDGYVVLFEGDFRRNFVHVSDMAGAFLHGMRNWDRMRGQVYNVGYARTLTKRELCENIRLLLPEFHAVAATVAKTDPDRRDYDVSVSKMGNTGFFAQIGLLEGIRELVKAFKMLPVGEMRNT